MRHSILLTPLLTLLVAVGLLSSCESDPIVTGADGYLLDLTLQSPAGETFPARILDTEIRVALPEDLDATTLIPTYHLSEGAGIAPLPQEVTDWSREITFEVTSHTGTKRTYSYQPSVALVVAEEQVELLSDADVEAFARRRVSILRGDLIIGGERPKEEGDSVDRVTDLTPLSGLREVTGNLILRDTYVGELDRLSSLERVGSILIEGETARRLQTISLPSLTYVADQIRLQSAGRLTTLQLPALHSLGSLDVKADSLTTISFPALTEAGTLKIILKCPLDKLDLSLLERVGSIRLEDSTPKEPLAERPDHAEVLLPKLRTCDGDLSLSCFGDVTRLDLSSLELVAGQLKLVGFSKLTDLSLDRLRSAGSILYNDYVSRPERQNHLLETLRLPSLKQVQGDISLKNFFALEELSAPKLTTTASLNVPPTVTRLDLPLLERVTGQLLLHRHDAEALPRLSEAKEIKLEPVADAERSGYDFSTVDSLGVFFINRADSRYTIRLPQSIGTLRYDMADQPSLPAIKGLETCGLVRIDNMYLLPGDVILPASIRVITGPLSLHGDRFSSFTAPGLEEVKELKVNGGESAETIRLPLLRKAETITIEGIELRTVELPALRSLGRLRMDGTWKTNSVMTALPDLSALQELESVSISGFTNMTDFTGIKSVVESGVLGSDGWSVSSCGYNPTFDDLKAGRYTK